MERMKQIILVLLFSVAICNAQYGSGQGSYGTIGNSTFSNVVTNGAGLHYNLYVPAGLYDGSQSLGASGAVLCSTGVGSVSWNNYMIALPEYSDSTKLQIASHNYGNGGYGSVSIGNIDAGGYAGNPNNGLTMQAQAGYTTISMDADTGYAQFGGGLSTINNTLDDGAGNMTVNNIFHFYQNGDGNPRMVAGSGGSSYFVNDRGNSSQGMYYGENADSGNWFWRGAGNYYFGNDTSPTIFFNQTAGKVGIGTTSPAYNLDVNGSASVSSLNVANQIDVTGTVHSTGNYTNDATISAATAITERAKDVAPHVTTSASTSGTVTASTSYWDETVYLSSGSTIASVTIALPSSGTLVGQIYRIHTKSIVTTLSVTGGSFADTAVVSLTAGQTIAYQAQNTSGAYIRIQ